MAKNAIYATTVMSFFANLLKCFPEQPPGSNQFSRYTAFNIATIQFKLGRHVLNIIIPQDYFLIFSKLDYFQKKQPLFRFKNQKKLAIGSFSFTDLQAVLWLRFSSNFVEMLLTCIAKIIIFFEIRFFQKNQPFFRHITQQNSGAQRFSSPIYRESYGSDQF